VPLIDAARVYLFGAGSNLHCVSLADGKTLWSRDLAADYDVPESYFGAGSSPILEAGRLLVNVGAGRSGAGIVAFSPETGKTLWKATDEQGSYSSPIAATIDGTRHAIFVTRLNAVSLDPLSGQVRFRFPFGKRGPTVNAASPLLVDGHLFLTASYGIGAVWAKIHPDDATTVWQNDAILSSQYTTPIALDGRLYGVDGRQDIGAASLRCIDPARGVVLWSEENFGYATLILAGGKLLIQKTDGTLVLAQPSPESFRKLASAQVADSTTRALPALAGGLYYVRDETTLKCLDLRPSR
jgi:outer membrane protein assembly factor BamB